MELFRTRFQKMAGARILRGWLLALLLPVALIAAACGGEDPTPTPKPRPTNTPMPAAAAPSAADLFQAKWDALITAAQAEGELSLVLAGNTSRALRTGVIPLFEEEFGIKVTSQGGTGKENASRMAAERDAGIYSVDAWVTGTTTPQSLLIPAGMLVPLEPLLIHPDALDTSNWFQNRLWWSDKDVTYTLGFSANGGKQQGWAWNTDELTPEDLAGIQSYWDWIDPKWTGKLAAVEPWSTGQGNNASFIHMEVGPDYWSRMISEVDLEIYTDQRTASEAVALGKQLVCLLGCGRQVSTLTKEGLPIQRYFPHAVKEGLTISTGGSNIMSVDQPPHPAAMQLWINWLLLQPAQQVLEDTTKNNSLRIDTTKEGVRDTAKLYEDVSYANPCCDPKYTAMFETAWAHLQTIREDYQAGNLN